MEKIYNPYNFEKVYGWGRGEHGRLGFGDDKSSKMVPQQVQLLAGEDIIQVSCGGTHSVALTRDGRMFSVSVLFVLYGKFIM